MELGQHGPAACRWQDEPSAHEGLQGRIVTESGWRSGDGNDRVVVAPGSHDERIWIDGRFIQVCKEPEGDLDETGRYFWQI